jgi:hypothetical protein
MEEGNILKDRQGIERADEEGTPFPAYRLSRGIDVHTRFHFLLFPTFLPSA